ncbi:MAG: hypothetical protein UT43_C0038G0002 [Parcubacteria group bacterium GW2011_GWC1_39_29]|uniref:Uncharacterized protein n=1 Tax=Candidatus Yanofskybacteria bacterium GW2011_GWD1_39_16 TaxID=1619030 RepID=A0A837HZC4_9BACT|nr:MAG: hypothetical protein UT35_C0034G0002 [Candidatus Yanofskybacteria bacterium GW2011_GWD1_39_16]KKR13669.1 MAG: hypothetical protein UT43_C0038G0002 [Parcubacteria group bacterium GW2011_GWC1_39_29]
MKDDSPVAQVDFKGQSIAVTHTAFIVPLIKDNVLFKGKGVEDEIGVLMVYNYPDEKPESINASTGLNGKSAGWGLPGGGFSSDRDTTVTDTVITELHKETGLVVPNLEERLVRGKLILMNRAGIMRWNKFHPAGEIPDHEFNPKFGWTRIDNHLHIFMGGVRFNGSNLATLMHDTNRSRQVFDHNLQVDGIAYIIDLDSSTYSEEEIASLNIEERNEIGKIGIFPLSLLRAILAFYEESGIAREERLFYKSHLQWLLEAYDTVTIQRRKDLGRMKAMAQFEKTRAWSTRRNIRVT